MIATQFSIPTSASFHTLAVVFRSKCGRHPGDSVDGWPTNSAARYVARPAPTFMDEATGHRMQQSIGRERTDGCADSVWWHIGRERPSLQEADGTLASISQSTMTIIGDYS